MLNTKAGFNEDDQMCMFGNGGVGEVVSADTSGHGTCAYRNFASYSISKVTGVSSFPCDIPTYYKGNQAMLLSSCETSEASNLPRLKS